MMSPELPTGLDPAAVMGVRFVLSKDPLCPLPKCQYWFVSPEVPEVACQLGLSSNSISHFGRAQ